jgi:hypothetical protein
MILAYLLLLTGLTISSVAIYYSVVGLTAIFSAAAVPIMIMGVSLEVAKLVCATWIKQHWTRVPILMKTYMVIAVIVLMLITSMGIFGFLSKAHNDQNLVSGDVQSRIAIYDEKIKTARDNVEANRKQLRQMDDAVDQVMGRSSDEKGADKAVAIRRNQLKDRAAIARDIEANQKTISKLNDEAAPIRAEVRKVDAEVGPIKYIAAFIYGVAPDASMLERAVTWIIILIVVVFDPLAVIMLLASQMSFGWLKNPALIVEQEPIQENQIKEWFAYAKKRARFWDKNKDPAEPVDSGEQEDLPVFDTQPVEFYPLDVEGEPEEELSEDTPKELDLVEEYPFRGQGLQPSMPMTASYTQPAVNDDHAFKDKVLADLVRDDNVDLGDFVPVAPEPVAPAPIPFSGKIYKFATNPETGEPDYSTPLEVKDITEEEFHNFQIQTGQIPAPELVAEETPVEPVNPVSENELDVLREASPGRNRGVMNTHLLAEADNAEPLGKASNSGFGNEFPNSPERGDLFLRTDFLPNRLYKFNDKKWIEVDKKATDVYAYNEMYIKHLIDQIDSGNFDVESLSDVEREQISQYLERNA